MFLLWSRVFCCVSLTHQNVFFLIRLLFNPMVHTYPEVFVAKLNQHVFQVYLTNLLPLVFRCVGVLSFVVVLTFVITKKSNLQLTIT